LAGTCQAEAVLADAVAAYREALAERLIAAYALGSLAHGGFSPLVSDIDLGLILAGPLHVTDRLAIRRVAAAVRAHGPGLSSRLSVFWGTPATLGSGASGGRFPAPDRLDLLVHGRLLAGQDARQGAARPGRAELVAAGAAFALRNLAGAPEPGDRLRDLVRRRRGQRDALPEIRCPPLLVSRGPQRLTKVVLFPVRFLFTAATGQVGSAALAAGHYLAQPAAPAAGLVTAALGWRLSAPADADAAAALLRRDLIPLYLHYTGDHLARLRAAGQDRLAAGFERWQARLRAAVSASG